MKNFIQKNQIKNVYCFLKKTVYFISFPILLVTCIYVYLDPFKVIYNYEVYYDENNKDKGGVVLNSGYVNIMTLNQQIDSIKYNSFILGNSRSGFYEINDWIKHLNADAVCFHLDAAMETCEGLCKKIRYLDKINANIDNVLIILDYSNFLDKNDDYHIFIQPPLINENRFVNNIKFHWCNFKAFCNPKFTKAYLGHYYIGKIFYDSEVLNKVVFDYDVKTSELKQIESEQKIKDGTFYDAERMLCFQFNSQNPDSISPQYISEEEKLNLEEIKQILDKHDATYRVVISPLYNQIKFNDIDLMILKSIFGDEYLYDFSGVNKFTSDYHNYYENSHYRPHVAREIMEIIYK